MKRRKQASDAYRSNSGKKSDFEALPNWLKRHNGEVSETNGRVYSGRQNDQEDDGRSSPPANSAGPVKRVSKTEDPNRSVLSGFLKTGSGARKAAKLLLLLGKDRAAEVLRHLSSEEVEAVTAEIAKIKHIEKPEAEKLLEEFGDITKRVSGVRGGYQVAKGILEKGLGEEEAERILRKVRPTGEETPFAFLLDLDYQQTMMLLRKEPPHIVTLVLSYLPSDKASKVLEAFPPEFQVQVVKRMAGLGRISPEALTTVEGKLRERLRTQGKVITEEVDGQEVLAEILKHMPISDGRDILGTLEQRYGEIAEQVRERLYSIDIVKEVSGFDLQNVLREWDDRELAVILKGVETEIEGRLYENISSRRRESISYEREHLGEMRRSEVEEVIKELIDDLRRRVEAGEIVLERDEKI